jgi:general secretion pathway protein J
MNDVRPLAHQPASSAGFTLIELLVVLTLLGLLVAATFGAVRFGTRAMDRTIASADSRQDIEAVHRFLRRLLSETGEPLSPDETGGRPPLFGDSDRMNVLAPMPRHLAVSGRAYVGLAVRQTDSGAALDAIWQPAFPRSNIEIPTVTTTLAADLASAEFAYFGDPTGTGRPEWYRTWTTPTRLPKLIRVNIVAADARPWPDLVVALPFAARAEPLQ